MNDGIVLRCILAEDLGIVCNVVGSRLGQFSAACHMLVDGIGMNVHTVMVVPVAHGDRQGHNFNAVCFDLFTTEIAGRIRSNLNSHYKFQPPWFWNRHTPLPVILKGIVADFFRFCNIHIPTPCPIGYFEVMA